MTNPLRTEPARVIGITTAVLIAIVQTFIGQGVIGADAGQSVINVIGILVPWLMAEVIRRFVSPASTSSGNSVSVNTTGSSSTS